MSSDSSKQFQAHKCFTHWSISNLMHFIHRIFLLINLPSNTIFAFLGSFVKLTAVILIGNENSRQGGRFGSDNSSREKRSRCLLWNKKFSGTEKVSLNYCKHNFILRFMCEVPLITFYFCAVTIYLWWQIFILLHLLHCA